MAAVQQVAQMESELSAARADDALRPRRKGLCPRGPRARRRSSNRTPPPTGSGGRPEAQGGEQPWVIPARPQGRAGGNGGEAEHAGRGSQGALDQARLNLEWSRVYAPANGFVTNVQLREGSYVHVGTPVLTCIDGDQWSSSAASARTMATENVRPGRQRTHLPGARFSRCGADGRLGGGSDEFTGTLPAIHRSRKWIDSLSAPGADHSLGVPSGHHPARRQPVSRECGRFTLPGQYWLNAMLTEAIQKIGRSRAPAAGVTGADG